MSTKHTPGPWQFDAENVGVNSAIGYGILDDNGSIGITVHLKRLEFIGQDKLIENAEANARLVAAAPELLEALEEVFHDLRQGAIPNPDDAWWNKAANTIAKAKGK